MKHAHIHTPAQPRELDKGELIELESNLDCLAAEACEYGGDGWR